jgi:hypothetical protein
MTRAANPRRAALLGDLEWHMLQLSGLLDAAWRVGQGCDDLGEWYAVLMAAVDECEAVLRKLSGFGPGDRRRVALDIEPWTSNLEALVSATSKLLPESDQREVLTVRAVLHAALCATVDVADVIEAINAKSA